MHSFYIWVTKTTKRFDLTSDLSASVVIKYNKVIDREVDAHKKPV